MATPVAMFGKDAKVAEQVREKLMPDYEVVHFSQTLEAAEAELPALCAGDLSIAPSSGCGSNAQAAQDARKVPQAIFFGGGFTDDEFDRISAAVKAKSTSVRFIKCQKRDVLTAGSFGPNPETIAKIYRKKMVEGE